MKIRSILVGLVLLGPMSVADARMEWQALDDAGERLKIVDTQVSYAGDDYAFVTLIGAIDNRSDTQAARIVVEVRYFDAEGRLIDTVTERLSDVVAPPHEKVSFRVRGVADKSGDAYVSHSARVVTAQHWADPAYESRGATPGLLDGLFPWLMLVLMGLVLVILLRKFSGKGSLAERMHEIANAQTDLMSRQLKASERLAAAVEQAASRSRGDGTNEAAGSK